MLAYQPHLLALSASSPFWSGTDTGYASNRTMMFQQLPTAGVPEAFTCWADFEAFIDDARTVGLVEDVDELRWDLRPSPRFGTLEVRVCDGVATLEEVTALTALTHCLVVHLDDTRGAEGLPAPLAPWQVRENKWRAARYGLDALVIRDVHNRETPLRQDLLHVLDVLSPTARRLHCQDELAVVERIVRGGAGYERQRAAAGAAQGDLRAVVRAATAEMATGPQWLDDQRD
jgi:carboxylate-amine ligase